MRFLYLDIDTLRPDHLGCYGYHRSTSPNIDALAERSTVFENVHASDVPCLPSRTALLTGRFGIHNGVVNHGGTDADPVFDGAGREFWSSLQLNSLPTSLKGRGGQRGGARMRTASISSFAQRHSAFHWHTSFDEAYNVGKFGLESADEVCAIARIFAHSSRRPSRAQRLDSNKARPTPKLSGVRAPFYTAKNRLNCLVHSFLRVCRGGSDLSRRPSFS